MNIQKKHRVLIDRIWRIFILFALLFNAASFPIEKVQAQSGEVGLISYWNFDYGSGTTADDTALASYENTGTLMNDPQWIPSPFGNALGFDANSDQYVSTLNNGDSLSIPSGGITITAWINASDVSGVRNILVKDKEWITSRGNYSLAVVDGKLRFGFSQASDHVDDWIDTQTSISPDKWYFVSVTHTFGNSGDIAIYINGVSQPLSDWACDGECDPDSAPATFPDPLYIGKSICNGENFDGLIDEVRVYDRVLTPTEFEYAPLSIGSLDNPIKIFFMPSANQQVISGGGQIMADYLSLQPELSGLSFEVNVPDSFADTVYGMCQNPETSMGFLPGFGYVLASDLCGVDVSHSAIRFGWPNYWGEVLVPRNSSYETLNELNGLDWGFPDPSSASGYMAAMAMFNSNGVTPANSIETGGHDSAVMALYNGDVDFATAFFSPPIKPEGEPSWQPGDDPDIPDAIVNTCDVTQDGSQLVCGDWQVMDARNQVREAAPDVVQAIRILTISGPIMNDALSFGPDFPTELRAPIENAMTTFAETAEWWDSIGNGGFYGWEGIASVVDADYDFTRDMVAAAGITLENWGAPPDYGYSLHAVPTHPEVHGHDWPPGVDVTLTIDDNDPENGVLYTEVKNTDDDPWCGEPCFDLNGVWNLQVGQYVTMTYGEVSKTVRVSQLTVTEVNTEFNTVSGIAAPGSLVSVDLHSQDGISRHVTAEPNGTWVADFSATGIGPGDSGRAIQLNPDGSDDGTLEYWRALQPEVWAHPNDSDEDWIDVRDWAFGETVSLTIDDDAEISNGTLYTDSGEVGPASWNPSVGVKEFHLGSFDLQPGHFVIVTGTTATKELLITDLDLTDINADMNTVSGTAVAGTAVQAWLHEEHSCNSEIFADQNGNWTADFNPCDLSPSVGGGVGQKDADGDSTVYFWSVPSPPAFGVLLDEANPSIHAGGFQPNATLTVTIDDPNTPEVLPDYEGTEILDQDGGLIFNPGYIIEPNDIVTLTDGTNTKVLRVRYLVINATDANADAISGTTEPYLNLWVWSPNDDNMPAVEVTAAENGSWAADYAGIYDLNSGMEGFAETSDEDGDGTMAYWRVSNPTFGVRANTDQIEGWEWPLGVTVTIEIDDPNTSDDPDPIYATVEEADWDSSQTWFQFNIENYDLKTGDIVTVTDGVTTKEHTVLDLAFTEFDIGADVVHGIGVPDSPVNIWTCDDFGCINREEFTDSSGNWSVDFSVPGDQDWEQETADIQPGSWIDSSQYDEDGDQTIFGMNVLNPTLTAFPENDAVEGWEWPEGAIVYLTIDNAPEGFSRDATAEVTSWGDSRTYIRFDFSDEYDLKVGDSVTLTADGTTPRTHVVRNLTVTAVSAEFDTVAGTADSDSVVYVWPHGYGEYELKPIANDGNWLADFADGFDIQPGTDGGRAEVRDEDGNSTAVDWHIANPMIQVRANDNRIEGYEWPEGATVTIDIDDPGTSAVNPDYTNTATVGPAPWDPNQTYFELNLWDVFNILAGFDVTVSDGETTKQFVVHNLEFTSIDIDANLVTGIAVPGQIDIWACKFDNCFNLNGVPVDGSGNWSADFQGVYDVQPGTWIDSIQQDEQGNGTMFGQTVEGAKIAGTVYSPELIESLSANGVGAGGVMVEACNTGQSVCRNALTDENGDYTVEYLPKGEFNIKAFSAGDELPGYSDAPINITNYITYDAADIVLPGPPTPPPSGAIEPSHEGGGTVVVFIGDPLTLTTHGDPGGEATFEITVYEDGYTDNGPMDETPAGSGTYIATIPPLSSHHGVAEIIYTITYPDDSGKPPVETSFFIYIDPSGVVKTVTGELIEGATVTLLRADSPNGPFEIVPDGSVLMSPSNRTNPDTTDEFGKYGWDVLAGFYKVRAEMPGCFSPTDPSQPFVESEVLTIPPPVTDLELILKCRPQITYISAPIEPIQVGESVEVNAFFTDPAGTDETHTALWDWGDETSSAGTVNGYFITDTHTYSTPGVYTLALTITDDDGAATDYFQYVVIFDPEGGFVTGGGWINSPEGAYTPDPSLTGKATFGFVSKYKKGANVPTGNTEFQFHVADLNFKSTSYDWLVIASSKAKYKGTGTINGSGEYKFMLSAIDGTPDMFRIKIWDKATYEVIYDNQLSAEDTADPTTVIQGGSIVVHKEK